MTSTSMDTGLILAGTGHRPNRLGGYCGATTKQLEVLANTVVNQLEPSYGYCGGALGWDMAWGYALIKAGVPYCLALPWPDMGSNWPQYSRLLLENLKEKADRVRYVSDYYHRSAYILRDIYMVDNAQGVVALLDPTATTSGTYQTCQYAESLHLPIMQLWSLYTAL